MNTIIHRFKLLTASNGFQTPRAGKVEFSGK